MQDAKTLAEEKKLKDAVYIRNTLSQHHNNQNKKPRDCTIKFSEIKCDN